MAATTHWPLRAERESERFCDDVSGNGETLASNSQRLFVERDDFDSEACVVNAFGMTFSALFRAFCEV
jgi:hypothetical protein